MNTDNKLKNTDFISTMAISKPTLNSMNPSAASPLMVVREEALISGIALLSAVIAASLADLVSNSVANL